MKRVRVHQHVNPLAKFYRELPVRPVELADSFENPDQMIHIDIGCGRGRLLLKSAEQDKSRNFLGLEIRKPLVDEANQIAKERGHSNLHYVFCNAPLDFNKVMSNIPSERIELVTIQFPDPWFKKRHRKRRMVDENLARAIREKLPKTARLFFQTDVEEVFKDFSETLMNAGFSMDPVESSILDFKTEREISVEERNLAVYRAIFG
ncbi:MAG: tRNA (guanosine(46)-N7)-methyltransferase TrmB [Pyrinomonadaceae bacterium]